MMCAAVVLSVVFAPIPELCVIWFGIGMKLIRRHDVGQSSRDIGVAQLATAARGTEISPEIAKTRI